MPFCFAIQGEYIFEGTIKARKETDSLDSITQDEEWMKKQLKDFKAFQAQLQKRKGQLVKVYLRKTIAISPAF